MADGGDDVRVFRRRLLQFGVVGDEVTRLWLGLLVVARAGLMAGTIPESPHVVSYNFVIGG